VSKPPDDIIEGLAAAMFRDTYLPIDAYRAELFSSQQRTVKARYRALALSAWREIDRRFTLKRRESTNG
jgi:hypothetical protein